MRIHLIGIAGTGMGSLAGLLKAAGHEVVVIGMKKGEKLTGKGGKESIATDMAIDEAKKIRETVATSAQDGR